MFIGGKVEESDDLKGYTSLINIDYVSSILHVNGKGNIRATDKNGDLMDVIIYRGTADKCDEKMRLFRCAIERGDNFFSFA